MPLAAHATLQGNVLRLDAAWGDPEAATPLVRAQAGGAVSSLDEAAAQRLVSQVAEIEARAWERRGTRSNGSVFTVETFLQYVLHDVVHHLWDVTGQQDGAASLQLA